MWRALRQRFEAWLRVEPKFIQDSWERIRADAEARPKTFSAIKIRDLPGNSVDVQISGAVPSLIHPGLRQWTAKMVAEVLDANPPRPIDWDAQVRAYDWRHIEPFLHYEWR